MISIPIIEGHNFPMFYSYLVCFRRLKEQERLLNKCIESNENNKTLSFCGTIYEEKDQVRFLNFSSLFFFYI